MPTLDGSFSRSSSPHHRAPLRHSIDDAHLAAIAISHGATLASFDSDFGAFVTHGHRWEKLAAT
jgi:predicted nucleic acid-binding protein